MMLNILRTLIRLLASVFYRMTVLGPRHVPTQGGALLVSNHISFADMILVLAGTGRFVRFLLPQSICQRRLLKPLLGCLRVIPLPPEAQPNEHSLALQQATEAVRKGEVVGIFAEGSISRIGVMLPFRSEFGKIMKGLEAPIIPVCLDGMWGSIFSYHQGRFFWKVPRRLRWPVTLSFGAPLPASTTAFEVRTAIQELNTTAWQHRRAHMKPLHRAFVQRARQCRFRLAWADARVPRLNFGGALTKIIFLAGRLRTHWEDQEMVGILLPPSVAGALVNFCALLMGKVPVNLNYTLTAEPLASCARQCNLKSIVTSKAFLDRVRVNLPCPALLIEEVAARPLLREKLRAFALSWMAPVSLLERALGRQQPGSLDDLATVIFSSGSTGEPKGIMLTHYNIASNADQLGQTYDFRPQNRFLGILPFFHSFGFTATLITPAIFGVGVAFHPNPLDAKAIGEMARHYGATHLMATPTFLQFYLRGCEAGDFGSLRLVMVGAEKLSDRLATAFEEKFGIRPVEGYGCTECSPVVTGNTHDFRAAGLRQTGSRKGSIGRPLPGISVRIVDPESRKPIPQGQSGLLLVRGPNVMRGYLGQPDRTAEVLQDHWYVTGDIGQVDEDGFLQITDRLSRFSKIGGEMVPHGRVEEKLHEVAGITEITFAVCGLPDPKKGERLIVLHTLPESQVDDVLQKLLQSGLPNLWIPRRDQFFHMDALPRLASGKMDLRGIRETARRLASIPAE